MAKEPALIVAVLQHCRSIMMKFTKLTIRHVYSKELFDISPCFHESFLIVSSAISMLHHEASGIHPTSNARICLHPEQPIFQLSLIVTLYLHNFEPQHQLGCLVAMEGIQLQILLSCHLYALSFRRTDCLKQLRMHLHLHVEIVTWSIPPEDNRSKTLQYSVIQMERGFASILKATCALDEAAPSDMLPCHLLQHRVSSRPDILPRMHQCYFPRTRLAG
mmetsp:Transcript_28908/g.61043  ORF Transcript_28908/g.61043 Transcript_28908/m.61043 type:complete len:219 (-) Transcript_28908:1521-2177(-)